MGGRWQAAVAALLAGATLTACTATLHGHSSASGGSITTTSSGGATSASGTSVRAQASFGSPAPAQGAGAQVVFSRGASAVLLLGLVLAETVNYMVRGYNPASQPQHVRSIAETCSCYRPQPEPEQPRARAESPLER